MDLRSVLNTSDNGDRGSSNAPPTPQQQSQPRLSQSPIQYPYREHNQPPPHSSPGEPVGQEYPRRHVQHQVPNVYPPPSPYQNAGPQYAARQTQPHHPQHSGSFHDARSPAGMPAPAQSSYCPTQSLTAAPGSAPGYPFTSNQGVQDASSSGQRHHFPPGHYALQQPPQAAYLQREAAHSSGNYTQQHQIPQTPPINTATCPPQQYIHQRSQSAQSTPTPTSAHSQQLFGLTPSHGSPTYGTRSKSEYRHHPQPHTPLGPPQSTNARPQPGTNFTQPSSPYQQRMTTPLASGQQPQSPAPPNAPLRQVSGSAHQESPASDTHQRSRSLQSREHSLSVSPRTRVASIASNSDDVLTIDSDRATTPAKRKLDDRNLSPKELEHKTSRPAPGEINGSNVNNLQPTSCPPAPRTKRLRRSQLPIWAQSAAVLGNKMPNQANFVLQKRAHSHLNGRGNGAAKTDRQSRNSTPEAGRASTSNASKSSIPQSEPGPQDILGPWEASITGVKPYEEISKTVADFIFIHVVNNPDIKEISSLGIQFEIEAKLGTLIDKDTNHRVDRLLDTECVLHDDGQVAFKSSMTEAHHKAFNDFLNDIVIKTDPRAPNGASRVQVHYKHSREVDRYFELLPELQSRLPDCVRSRLGSRVRNVKARVTYDQRTGEVLNKIVKARVADIDIHMPTNPMDCRLSINLEMNWDGPVQELEQLRQGQNDRLLERQKDRLSYKQGHYQIDLTQVILSNLSSGKVQKTDKDHELEIELASSAVLDQGAKAMSGAPHRYQELIEGFLDNVRVLARKARDFG